MQPHRSRDSWVGAYSVAAVVLCPLPTRGAALAIFGASPFPLLSFQSERATLILLEISTMKTFALAALVLVVMLAAPGGNTVAKAQKSP